MAHGIEIRRAGRRLGLAFLAAWASGSVACSSSSPLASNGEGGGGAGGEGGTAGSGGAGLAGGGGAGGMGGAAPMEPDGPPRLSIVHGVVDQDRVQLCALPYPAGDPSVLPWPRGGLEFAEGRVVDPLDALIPSGVDVALYVLGGDLEAASGASCEQILDDPATYPDVVALPLGVLSANDFTAPRSLLLVPNGCMGGEGHEHEELEPAICGPGYTPSTPNLGVTALAMSRLSTTGKVAFQAVQASAAMPAMDIEFRRGEETALSVEMAPELVFGAVGPFPPFATYSSVELVDVHKIVLSTVAPGATSPTSEIALGTVFDHGPVAADDIESGRVFVAVAVGARAGVQSGPWWNAYTYTLLDSDPVRASE